MSPPTKATLQRRLAKLAKEAPPDVVERLCFAAEAALKPKPVTSADEARVIVEGLLTNEPYECLAVVALDRKLRPLASTILTRGNDGFTIVCPKQIFRWALLQGRYGAGAVVIAHNHPSGDARPSVQDGDVTDRVARAGRMLGITLIDHLIVAAGSRTYSFAENGRLPPHPPPAEAYTAP